MTRNKQDEFWDSFERHYDDHLKIFTLNYKYVYQLIFTVKAILNLIETHKPDVIFFPLRGAAPFAWILEQLNYISGDGSTLPHFSYLPIGSHINPNENRPHGLSRIQKLEAISLEIERIKKYSPQIELNTIMLIDEAQSGSTSSEALGILKELLTNVEKFVYLVLKDARRDAKSRLPVQPYLDYVSGQIDKVIGFSISAPLVTVDRPAFLDAILKPQDNNSPDFFKMFHTLHNTGAKKVFQMITLWVLYPRAAQKLLLNNSLDELAEDDQEAFGKLSSWLEEIRELVKQSEQDEQRKRTKLENIMNWLKNLHTYATTPLPNTEQL